MADYTADQVLTMRLYDAERHRCTLRMCAQRQPDGVTALTIQWISCISYRITGNGAVVSN